MTAIINPNKRGAKGDTGAAGSNGTNGTNGAAGAAATVAVGTVTTGASGSSASVTNSGTSSAAVFNFTIPRGDVGPAGPSKRIVTATGTTDASGNVSFTFSPAFATTPVILPSMSSTNSREYWRITAQSASGVTVQAFSQNQSFLSLLGLDVLTAGTTPINARAINIVAIEM